MFKEHKADIVYQFPEKGTPLEMAGQTIYVVRFKENYICPDKNNMLDELERRIPEYMIPSIVIKSSFGSSLTAAVLDTVTAKIMEKGLTPGIYYATDIISMLDVIKQNVNREINYYCNDESINIGTEGIVYEEGIL